MRYVFTYSGSDPTVHGAAVANVIFDHNGQQCAIVRDLTPDEADIHEVGPMHEVRFDDGCSVHVFADELTEVPVR
jgi:hypothetical protein